jgi:hypothetical protein
MNSEKAIVRGFSIKPEQVKRLEKVIDIKRHGQFSQFVVDAISEKLDRLEKDKNPKNEQIAS